jgi:nucleotide-binding universal stress UspA family protein
MGSIVVGVDGSKGSEGALRFALAEARLRGAGLRVVCAWATPAAAYAGLAYVPTFDLREVEEQAAAEKLQAARAVLGDDPGVTVELIAVEGHPADALLSQAQGADMLVVGSRGLGGFSSLLLGSISQQVAHHAPCPVAIIPHQAD